MTGSPQPESWRCKGVSYWQWGFLERMVVQMVHSSQRFGIPIPTLQPYITYLPKGPIPYAN